MFLKVNTMELFYATHIGYAILPMIHENKMAFTNRYCYYQEIQKISERIVDNTHC